MNLSQKIRNYTLTIAIGIATLLAIYSLIHLKSLSIKVSAIAMVLLFIITFMEELKNIRIQRKLNIYKSQINESASKEIETLLRLIRTQFGTNTSRASIFLVEPKSQTLRLFAYSGDFAPLEVSLTFRKGEGVVGKVWEMSLGGQRNVIYADLTNPKSELAWNLSPTQLTAHETLKSIIAVPIIVDDGIAGVLAIDSIEEVQDQLKNSQIIDLLSHTTFMIAHILIKSIET